MSFVKLDAGLLNSTLWFDLDASRVFIVALLLAVPEVRDSPTEVISPDSCESAGWSVAPGRYGFVPASGPGLVHSAILDQDAGMAALRRLQLPDPASRSGVYDGRRLVRISGGFLVINFAAYHDQDHGNAARCKAWRERKRSEKERFGDMVVTPSNGNDMLSRHVATCHDMQAEAEAVNKTIVSSADANDTPPSKTVKYSAGFEAFWQAWPLNARKRGKGEAYRAWKRQRCEPLAAEVVRDVLLRATAEEQWKNGYCPMPSTYLSGRRWEDPLPAAPAERRVSL